MTNEDALPDVYGRIETAAADETPRFTVGKYSPKPWWSNELRESRKRREKAYFIYRRCKSYSNLVEWKRLRAQYKQLILKEKKES